MVSGRVEPWPHVSGVNHYTMGKGFGEVLSTKGQLGALSRQQPLKAAVVECTSLVRVSR